MLVSQTSPVGVELFSYANAFFCSNKFAYMLAKRVKTLYFFVSGYEHAVYKKRSYRLAAMTFSTENQSSFVFY